MDDVTDTVFRQIISSCAAPDLCFSEFVNVDGLMSAGRKKLLPKLDWSPSEPPLIAHIWGLKPDNFYTIAEQIASGQLANELGLEQNFAGIDLNMGCPVKQVTKSGACSGLINNHQLAAEIINATKKGSNGRLPVSVKTRIGFNSIDPNWTKFLFSQQLSMLTIHLRTTKEMSAVPAHWDELVRLKQERDELSPKTLLIANGDIMSRSQGEQLALKYELDGIMIGRGIFHDPFIFSAQSPWESMTPKERLAIFTKQLKMFAAWSDNPDKAIKRMNKYSKIYINGFNGSKELRERVAAANSMEEMLEEVSNGAKLFAKTA